MAEEKKVTKVAAAKKAAPKKTTAKKAELVINAENVGFKAGDVYQALSTSEKALTLAQIAKKAKITTEEALLGMGWLLKEGKIAGEDNKIALA